MGNEKTGEVSKHEERMNLQIERTNRLGFDDLTFQRKLHNVMKRGLSLERPCVIVMVETKHNCDRTCK